MMRHHDYRTLALLLAVLSGSVLRFIPGILAAFPVNDGGMLLAMIRDLRSNEFLIPSFTSYNFADIPFAYPPFGMYLVAFLSQWLPLPDIELLRWVPAVVSSAMVAVFYRVARQFLDSVDKALIATLLYAVMPGASDWLIMGGGLTRSFGILFFLLAVGYAYRLFRNGETQPNLALGILCCALAVLSHPEVALQTAAVIFVLWSFFGRDAEGVRRAAIVALGTALLTAPWWGTVLYQHGFSPFWSAIHTGVRETLVASLFHTFFSTQGGLPIISTLSLAGILVTLRRRAFLLLCCSLLPFVIDPRNAPAIAIFPLLMLAAEGAHFLYREFRRAYSITFPGAMTGRQPLLLSIGVLGAILIYFFAISYALTSRLVEISLSPSSRALMSWIRENTPPGSRFLLLTNAGEIHPMTDSYQEWFPVLAERQSINTLQGMEWILGEEFFAYSQELIALQECPEASCLRSWLEQRNLHVDYILFNRQRASQKLADSLRADQWYEVVYESPAAVVFVVTP